jgi:two-component system, chemotaxis family, chemotaxis protein CheY
MAITALIVDDSTIAAEIIRYHLERAGCTVVGDARNAAEGLKMFRLLRPDVVTLDLMMPKVEGLDSMAALRAMKQEAPDIVVIVVSIVPFEKTRDDFINEGVFAYVVKPFNQFSFKPVLEKLHRAFPGLAHVQHPD